MATRLVKIILDTSILIPFINDGVDYLPESDSGEQLLHCFSTVVAMELYAGAQDRKSAWLLDRLFYAARKTGRIVAPGDGEWQTAGKVLSTIGRNEGFKGHDLMRLTNDLLIALSGKKIGAVVYTANIKDFRLLQKYADFRMTGPVIN